MRTVSCTLRNVREINHPYGSNGSLVTLIITKAIFMLNLPNEMQYATDRKDTSQSERIERIAKHTAPFTIIKSLPNDMQYSIYDRHTVLNGPQGHLTIRTDQADH